MKPKNTWLLVVLAVGLFAFIWLLEPRLRPPPPGPRRVMTPAIKPAEVTSIQIESKGQVRVERTNGAWVMTKPLVYPVKSAAVDNFLTALAELSPRTRITAEELRKIKNVSDEYGFGSPQARITLEFSQGPPRTLLLGSLTPARDGLYAELVGGADSVDVIGNDFLRLVPREAGDWRDSTFVNLAGLDYDRISVAHAEKTMELTRDATNKLWRMIRPTEGRADNPKIENLLVNLQSLRISSFVTDAPSAADLQQFGLQPPQLALAFGLGTNQLFSLQFGGSPAADSSLIYARSNAQSTVVLLPRDLVAGWTNTADDFRERHLLDVALNFPDQIEVSGEENFKVQFTNGVWFVTDAASNQYRADGQYMQKFLVNLANLQVADQPEKTEKKYIFQDVASAALLPTLDLGGPGARPFRSYILTHSPAPATTNELDFGIVTNGFRLAKRTDEQPVVTVNTNDFDNLPARALDFRERQIWSFDSTNVTRLTVRNNGKTQVWDHKKYNEWEPANTNYLVKDPVPTSMYIEQVMTILGELRVLDWVERGDTNRAKYGIDDQHPRIALDVTKGDVSKTLFIDFGGGLPYGKGAYASVPVPEGQNWTNWIVTIPPDDIKKFNDWLPK